MNRNSIFIATGVLSLWIIGLMLVPTVQAFPGGITGRSGNPTTNGGAFCTACHFGGDVPTVTLAGPSMLAPGEVGTFTLTIESGASQLANPGSDGAAGGFNVSTTEGTLGTNSTEVRVSDSEVTHTAPKNVDGAGNVVFEFTWQAPANATTVTMFGAGNSVNGNRSDAGTGTSGDNASTDTLEITVSNPSAVSLTQNESVTPMASTIFVVLFGGMAVGTFISVRRR